MNVPQLARYNGTVKKAYNFVEENIEEFPVSLFKIIKKFKWGLLTYEQLAKNNNCSIEDICDCLGTDGYSIYNGNNYTIAYNNTISSQGRINFTIAHEIGHIILEHHRDFDVTEILSDNFTNEEYKTLENEANCFARNILAPAPLVKQMKLWNMLFDIPSYFDITFKATTTRITLLNNDLYYLTDNEIKKMQDTYTLYKECSLCQTPNFNLASIYCYKCNCKLNKGDGFKMKIYNGIDSLKECPTCENADFSLSDKYCIICGNLLHNFCSSSTCSIELPSNARYCNLCGNKSIFYKNGLLKSWELENKNCIISDSELNEIWSNFISNLRLSGKIVLYTNLINSSPILLDNNTIGINFENGISHFGYAVLSKKENIDIIQNHLSDSIKVPVKIKFLNKAIPYEPIDLEQFQFSPESIPINIIE